MTITIRDVREHELDSVLALNNAAGSTILPLDSNSVRKFYNEAVYFRVAEAEDHLAGFLVALRENADYGSGNFLWFRDHYPAISLHRPHRRRAPLSRCRTRPRVLCRRDEFCRSARAPARLRGVPRTARRYRPAVPRHLWISRSRPADHGQRRAPRRLLARDMCSFPYVREMYLDHPGNGLPNQPWLAERAHAVSTPQARSA